MLYSVLDLAQVPEGSDARRAIANSLDLARHAEGWGYHRFWLAEHHNMPGIASVATAILIGQVAAVTKTIRVGAGGIMLPNHAPFRVAEEFGTLATMFPDRIDLGLGRAPGGDLAVARALRRNLGGEDDFPNDVVEVMTWLGPDRPEAVVRAHPGVGTQVPVWILGSSLYGASLAAALGLPYAFASHFAPAALREALALYRDRFTATPFGDTPRFMLAINAIGAETDAEADFLLTSQQQSFARLRMGRPGLMPPPVADIAAVVPAPYLAQADAALSIRATGGLQRLRKQLAALIADYQPDEVILTGAIFDHAKRLRSFQMAAQAMRDVAP